MLPKFRLSLLAALVVMPTLLMGAPGNSRDFFSSASKQRFDEVISNPALPNGKELAAELKKLTDDGYTAAQETEGTALRTTPDTLDGTYSYYLITKQYVRGSDGDARAIGAIMVKWAGLGPTPFIDRVLSQKELIALSGAPN